jgi:hypothetical protein
MRLFSLYLAARSTEKETSARALEAASVEEPRRSATDRVGLDTAAHLPSAASPRTLFAYYLAALLLSVAWGTVAALFHVENLAFNLLTFLGAVVAFVVCVRAFPELGDES